MKELWKRWIYNNEVTRYEISNFGQIHDTIKDTYTYGNKTKEGYMSYTFYLCDGSHTSKLVHRLVAELFVYNPSDQYDIVDHINAVKDDNRASNLRWCTNEMNIRYAAEKGAMMKNTGEDSPRHKYTKNQINQVIHMLEDGNFTAKEISAITGVHVHAVRDLKHKRTWIDDVEGLELGLKSGIRKFSDEQIHKVIQLLDGILTVKEISDITGVSKSVVRGIYKREIYTYLTDGVRNLSYKKISTRANKDIIMRAIALLETRKYTCSDIQNITGLSRSVIEKLAYHQRWQFLTKGKNLGFKGSVK